MFIQSVSVSNLDVLVLNCMTSTYRIRGAASQLENRCRNVTTRYRFEAIPSKRQHNYPALLYPHQKLTANVILLAILGNRRQHLNNLAQGKKSCDNGFTVSFIVGVVDVQWLGRGRTQARSGTR